MKTRLLAVALLAFAGSASAKKLLTPGYVGLLEPESGATGVARGTPIIWEVAEDVPFFCIRLQDPNGYVVSGDCAQHESVATDSYPYGVFRPAVPLAPGVEYKVFRGETEVLGVFRTGPFTTAEDPRTIDTIGAVALASVGVVGLGLLARMLLRPAP